VLATSVWPRKLTYVRLQALARIKEQEAVVKAARKKATELKAGMDIFSIPQPPYKELATMDSDLEKLAQIWGIVEQWEGSYATWKQGKFKDIQARAASVWIGAC
jgi:hypothetical protein